MIAQQTWLFLSGYASLRIRSSSNSNPPQNGDERLFRGVIMESSIESIAHLGRYAFSEIGNAAVAPLMFNCKKISPNNRHSIWAVRLNVPRDSKEQASLLKSACQNEEIASEITFQVRQISLMALPGAPLIYWIPQSILQNLINNRLENIGNVVEGLGTRWDERFLRIYAELDPASLIRRDDSRWHKYVKGGGYYKWYGLHNYTVDWEHEGSRILNFRDGNGRLRSRPQNRSYYFMSGYTYSAMAQGSLSVRLLGDDVIAGDAGPIIKIPSKYSYVLGILNSRIVSYMIRMLSPTLQLKPGYVKSVPIPPSIKLDETVIQFCIYAKKYLTSINIMEQDFQPNSELVYPNKNVEVFEINLLICEAYIEEQVFKGYELSPNTVERILAETGSPSGWYPLVTGYDAMLALPSIINGFTSSKVLYDYLSNLRRIYLDSDEMKVLKSNLHKLYESGFGAKGVEVAIEYDDEDEDAEDSVAVSLIPIPTETFLEELSVKLQIHPISVYWLLEGLRAEGVRCKPEEQRLLEDRLTVLVLRLLGHRWPKQIEAGEAVPPWADSDGIIPLSAAITLPSGQRAATLTERLRERLRADLGDLGAQQSEALLQELTGRTLDGWLRRDFFKRHSSQFKKRPIAWQLQSTPVQPASGGRRRQGNRQEPAFACLLYYHRCDTDILARLRTQYIEPLIAAEENRLAAARRHQPTLLDDANQRAGENQARPNTAANGETQSETLIAQATLRIQELQDFTARLRQVEAHGFDHPVLTDLLAAEPLDRWSGDGHDAPTDRNALYAQEATWRVDINDGVRVNIAPLQAAGLLAHEVLNRQDVAKAIEDRARWRADERRWVRAGKLPRCGWLPVTVPESPQWTALAPAREAERLRLQEKRQQLVAELGQSE